jgi:hypothetical protein
LQAKKHFIEDVHAGQDVHATLQAATDIGPVTATRDIMGKLDAERIYSVSAQQRGIRGGIHAQQSIGNVSAGRDIRGPIVSGTLGADNDVAIGPGTTGQITAGAYQAGNITRSIQAGHNIYGVQAKGDVSGSWSSYETFDSAAQSAYESALQQWLADPSADPADLPRPPRMNAAPVASSGGNVNAPITAGGSLGGVLADQHIQQDITAGQRLYLVAARGAVQGNIQSQVGSVVASAGREFSGDVSADGHIFAGSYDTFSGSTNSARGVVSLNTWGAITSGTHTGPGGVYASAYDGITAPNFHSSQGMVGISSLGDVETQLDAAKTASANVLGAFNGSVVSHDGNAFANAAQKFEGSINAHQTAVAASLGNVKASIIADRGQVITKEVFEGSLTVRESALLYVRDHVNGAIRSTEGDLYIEAGRIEGSVQADQGFVALDIYGNVDATVQAAKGAIVSSLGTVTKPISSAHGTVLVVANGAVSGEITAKGGIGVLSWDKISGNLTAAHGAINVFAYGDVSSQISAGYRAEVSTWGSLTATVQSGGDVEIFARHNVTEPITAQHHARVVAGGNVSANVTAGGGTSTGQ